MEAQDGLAELREEAFVFVELIAALASWAKSGMLPSMDVQKAYAKVGNFMTTFRVQPFVLRDAVSAMGTPRGLSYVKNLASDMTKLAKTAPLTTQLTPELLKLISRLPKAVTGDEKAIAALQKGLAGKSVVVTEQAAQMASYKDQSKDFARLKEIVFSSPVTAFGKREISLSSSGVSCVVSGAVFASLVMSLARFFT
jgi:hypothetical protein